MDKLRVWSVLLLGMLMAGTSGLAMAAGGNSGSGGSGGYSRPGGSGGHSGSGGYNRPGGSGGYNRPGGYSGHGGSGGYSGHGWYGGHGGYNRYGGHGWYSGHDNFGIGIVIDPFLFAPWSYPGPYYSPYYYPPAVVNVPATPPVYIEGGERAEPAPQASASWITVPTRKAITPMCSSAVVTGRPSPRGHPMHLAKGDRYATSLENCGTRPALVDCCLHHDAKRTQRDGAARHQQKL